MVHLLDSMILFSLNPIGFLLSVCAIIYGEYLLFKSIHNDSTNKKSLRRLYRYIKKNMPNRLSLIDLQKAIAHMAHRKEHITVIEISDNLGLSSNSAVTLQKEMTQ